MILSTQTDLTASRLGLCEAIRLIKNAGFDAFDLSLFRMSNDNDSLLGDSYMDEIKKAKEVSEEYGIICNQAHAPFSFRNANDDEYRKNVIIPRTIRSMEISSFLGAKIIVVHPFHFVRYSIEDDRMFDLNIDFYNSLLPYAKEYNIKIALENMWQRDPKRRFICDDVCSRSASFLRYLEALDKDYFTACLDLGHCGLVGDEAENMIYEMKGRIGALHVHDNDYIDDKHTLPYQCRMNWDNITRAFAETEYKGDFTFEADNFLVNNSPDFLPISLKYMEQTGRFLINKINGFKK